MFYRTLLLALTLCLGMATSASQASDATEQLMAEFKAKGVQSFNAARGAAFWNREFTTRGESRSCSNCHGARPTKPGKHLRTGKKILPLAPSVNPKALSNSRHINKWLKRNCKWTLGRTCTAAEKGDVLQYLESL